MINNLDDLKDLIKLCRKNGITEVEFGPVKLKLGELPVKQSAQDFPDVELENPFKDFPQGILSPEQEAHYAFGGMPIDDPTLKVG